MTSKLFALMAKGEPYRIFFPLGISFLVWGALIWLPQLWSFDNYPILAHRYLMLNGFSASFIAGFLMTAVPRFSETENANFIEVFLFVFLTVIGLVFAFMDYERIALGVSALQALSILYFMAKRIGQRKVNPPYSFIFIFIGLVLWEISALTGMLAYKENLLNLHYEGSITALILGVGCRLIPGILGHSEIVQNQRKQYENEKLYLSTVPFYFYGIMMFYIGSYFVKDEIGNMYRAVIVILIGLFYWKIYQFPKEKSSLTWNIWISCWLIVISFILKAFWIGGDIHVSHAFFISGNVLLTLLIATRVLQSHGPKDKKLENLKVLYVVSSLIILSGITRVSSVLFPAEYFRHLGYSSIILTIAVLLWSYHYIPFVKISNKEIYN